MTFFFFYLILTIYLKITPPNFVEQQIKRRGCHKIDVLQDKEFRMIQSNHLR